MPRYVETYNQANCLCNHLLESDQHHSDSPPPGSCATFQTALAAASKLSQTCAATCHTCVHQPNILSSSVRPLG